MGGGEMSYCSPKPYGRKAAVSLQDRIGQGCIVLSM